MADKQPPKVKKICGAKTRSGGKCQQAPMPNGRCRIHGGKSLGGLNSPVFKTGRHSKYLPKGLLSKYQQALSDPDLLQLRDEIALVDAMIDQEYEKYDKGFDTWQQWESIQSEYAALLGALQAIPTIREKLTGESPGSKGRNTLPVVTQWRGPRKLKTERMDETQAGAKMLESLTNLGNLLVISIDNKESRETIVGLVEQRRRLVESERKWFIENQQIITAEKAMLLIAAIADIIKTNVTDQNQKRIIIENINRLALAEPSG